MSNTTKDHSNGTDSPIGQSEGGPPLKRIKILPPSQKSGASQGTDDFQEWKSNLTKRPKFTEKNPGSLTLNLSQPAQIPFKAYSAEGFNTTSVTNKILLVFNESHDGTQGAFLSTTLKKIDRYLEEVWNTFQSIVCEKLEIPTEGPDSVLGASIRSGISAATQGEEGISYALFPKFSKKFEMEFDGKTVVSHPVQSKGFSPWLGKTANSWFKVDAILKTIEFTWVSAARTVDITGWINPSKIYWINAGQNSQLAAKEKDEATVSKETEDDIKEFCTKTLPTLPGSEASIPTLKRSSGRGRPRKSADKDKDKEKEKPKSKKRKAEEEASE